MQKERQMERGGAGGGERQREWVMEGEREGWRGESKREREWVMEGEREGWRGESKGERVGDGGRERGMERRE
jgi:hypothetical protein